jgi:hypothetical protein
MSVGLALSTCFTNDRSWNFTFDEASRTPAAPARSSAMPGVNPTAAYPLTSVVLGRRLQDVTQKRLFLLVQAFEQRLQLLGQRLDVVPPDLNVFRCTHGPKGHSPLRCW